MIRAEEIKSSLGSEFPSFAKLLVRSHVSSCFWMGLPMTFCKLHLPRKDMPIVLEDESGEQFVLKFIADKTGLSAGWRKFAAAHKLVEGDVLIFQLVEPNKFKVYVVRANDLTEVDGALGLLNLDAHIKQSDTGKDDADNAEIAPNNKKRKRLKTLPLAVVKKKKKMGLPKSVQNSIQSVKQFENDSEEVGSEVLAGPRLSGSAVRFRDVKSFTDFNILVDGLCIDSELPEHIRVKYYALCCSKNTFIHARLVRGLNSKLVAGIICETVNIADAIRACKLTTSRDEYLIWEKTLKSFELMGMSVGFLRARLRYLLSLAFESDDAPDARRYVEAKSGKGRAEDEIRDLEAKLVELKHTSEKFCADIESLKSKAERYEHKFQEEVDAPW
ncbi:B3 domain-containing protein Os01g0234100-like [Actinidia eriantha]|uniref:B3 domain-containing protein Os01g0234100-like n=1 Tax=Actinidia eriantha TaxID=165200 RepID=UPI0025872538|nr:B3 domain-containing protein Os01g0234100-like [Actinidia eriantha]XP_057491775.1 B3 domain-containing protein Os01g0234100-like [Actinidia eriantha]